MIVIPDRFHHVMILQNAINIRFRDPVKLGIGSAQIKAIKTVKLPVIKSGKTLNFEGHIYQLRKPLCS